MASERDFQTVEASFESLDVSSRVSRVNGSSVLEYCRQPSEGEPRRDQANRKIYYCSLCPSWGGSSTTGVRHHLLTQHEIDCSIRSSRTKETASLQLQRLWKQASMDQAAVVNSLVLKSVLHKEVLEQALVTLIVVRNLPFRIVEWPEFHTYCQALNPESKASIIASHGTVSKLIGNSFQQQKDTVRKKLQSALTSIHLSMDIWTSPNNHLLLAICAHFIDSQGIQTKALLALRPVVNHSGIEQWNTLEPVLHEYGIIRKLEAIIADNATTNDTLCREISQ